MGVYNKIHIVEVLSPVKRKTGRRGKKSPNVRIGEQWKLRVPVKPLQGHPYKELGLHSKGVKKTPSRRSRKMPPVLCLVGSPD